MSLTTHSCPWTALLRLLALRSPPPLHLPRRRRGLSCPCFGGPVHRRPTPGNRAAAICFRTMEASPEQGRLMRATADRRRSRLALAWASAIPRVRAHSSRSLRARRSFRATRPAITAHPSRKACSATAAGAFAASTPEPAWTPRTLQPTYRQRQTRAVQLCSACTRSR